MALLPSGIHFCINSDPLDTLLQHIRDGHGLYLPDLLSLRGPDDLRRYMRLLWLLPLGADCAMDSPLHSLSAPAPAGHSLVDSGYRMDHLPAHLDERDRHALSLFWQSPRCRDFLSLQMGKISELRQRLLHSQSPEDQCLVEWFGISSPARGSLLTLQAEEEAERTAPFAVHFP